MLSNIQDYGIDAIESLSFKDGVRRRIQMYLGSATTEGLWQGLKEIINNSTDESSAGFGDKIIIEVKEQEQIFSVRDFGRSVPFGIRDNGENVLVSIFSKAHTGGKFDHKAYAQSVGTNGIGASATCLSASFFNVFSYRNNIAAIAKFKEGDNISYEEIPTKEPTGTYIVYSPSKEVFIDSEEPLTYTRICKEVENISYLNSGVEFIVKDVDNKTEKKFYAKNGIMDFIKNKIANPIISKPIYSKAKDSTDEVEIALIWTAGKEQSYCFVNGGYCNEGGTPVTAIKTAVTNAMKKNISKDIDPEIFRKGLCYVINCRVANPSFEGQTKNKILNGNLRTLTGQAAKSGLESFVNTSDFEIVADLIKKIAKAEKAADKARSAVLTAEKDLDNKAKKRAILSAKLKDCKVHGPESGAILAISEGDSALGALAQARPVENVALIPVLGKIISALKHPTEDILKNEEVKAIFAALGCGFFEKYNEKKLRYQYVAIATDGDKDGDSISCLIITLFYFMCPEFLKQGRLIRMKMPLDVLEYKDKLRYAFSTQERDEIMRKYGKPISIGHKKGIGENTAEETKEAVFGEQKHWEQYKIENYEEFQSLIQMLMGKEVKERKDYIMKNVDFSRITE